MLAELLLSDWPTLRLDTVQIESDVIKLEIHSTTAEASCPVCGQPSDQVHSRYIRHPDDLALASKQVQWQLHVRRFRCLAPDCPRQIFTERLPEVLGAFARRTDRLAKHLRDIAFSLGGEAGARLAAKEGLQTSPDTLLRLIRDTSLDVTATLHIIGIDEWAFRKGHTYGTIFVDLEQHRVVDLLPDCSSESVTTWLQAHPGIEIIARDRSSPFATAATEGAPDAVQVADRWHLLVNLRDTLERLLEQEPTCLGAAATVPEPPAEPAIETTSELEPVDPPPVTQLTKPEQKRQATRQRRLARYQVVMDLHQRGVKMRAIARQLGLARPTVRRYVAAGAFPEMAERCKRPSILDPYLAYLQQRWAEGCHNGAQLYRDIKGQGYTGSKSLVGRWVADQRRGLPRKRREAATSNSGKGQPPVRRWSVRRVAWLLLRAPNALTSDDQAALDRVLEASPAILCAYQLAQDFQKIVRQRASDAFEPWLQEVAGSGVPALQTFAAGLERDKAAVFAALTLPWSNGQTEGQVNRLKLIKRSMYGRANFDLLRLRVLYTGRDVRDCDAAVRVVVFVIKIAGEPIFI